MITRKSFCSLLTIVSNYLFYTIKQINTTKFMSLFVAHKDYHSAFTQQALTAIFKTIPSLEQICLLLPEAQSIFEPLESGRYEEMEEINKSAAKRAKRTKEELQAEEEEAKKLYKKPKRTYRLKDDHGAFFAQAQSISAKAAYSLFICHRKYFMPMAQVRKAKVEDCDSLAPMLTKRNVGYQFSHNLNVQFSEY